MCGRRFDRPSATPAVIVIPSFSTDFALSRIAHARGYE